MFILLSLNPTTFTFGEKIELKKFSMVVALCQLRDFALSTVKIIRVMLQSDLMTIALITS